MSEQFTGPDSTPETSPTELVPIESVVIDPVIQQYISIVNQDAANSVHNLLLLYGPADQTGKERIITRAYAIKNVKPIGHRFDLDHAVAPKGQINKWHKEDNAQLSLSAAGVAFGRRDEAEYFIAGRHVPVYYSGTPELDYDETKSWNPNKFSLWTKNDQGEITQITDVRFTTPTPLAQ